MAAPVNQLDPESLEALPASQSESLSSPINLAVRQTPIAIAKSAEPGPYGSRLRQATAPAADRSPSEGSVSPSSHHRTISSLGSTLESHDFFGNVSPASASSPGAATDVTSATSPRSELGSPIDESSWSRLDKGKGRAVRPSQSPELPTSGLSHEITAADESQDEEDPLSQTVLLDKAAGKQRQVDHHASPEPLPFPSDGSIFAPDSPAMQRQGTSESVQQDVVVQEALPAGIPSQGQQETPQEPASTAGAQVDAAEGRLEGPVASAAEGEVEVNRSSPATSRRSSRGHYRDAFGTLATITSISGLEAPPDYMPPYADGLPRYGENLVDSSPDTPAPSRLRRSLINAASSSRFIPARLVQRLSRPSSSAGASPILSTVASPAVVGVQAADYFGGQHRDAGPGGLPSESEMSTHQLLQSPPYVANERRSMNRSESAPELARMAPPSSAAPNPRPRSNRFRQVQGPFLYAATDYVQGARMGPPSQYARRHTSRPSTAHSVAASVRSNATGGSTSGSRGLSFIANLRDKRKRQGASQPASPEQSRRPSPGPSRAVSIVEAEPAPGPSRQSPLTTHHQRYESFQGPRPSLLRLAQSSSHANTPTAAVNAVQAGGVTLHVSGPGAERFLTPASLAGRALAGPVLLPGTLEHVHPRDLFDTMLPRELRVAVLQALIAIHVDEHDALTRSDEWRGAVANETRWTGKELAVRELARISRVCRTWQSLVLDGQLWRSLEPSRHPDMSYAALMRVARSAGPFVRQLSLAGLAELPSAVLEALTQAHSPEHPVLPARRGGLALTRPVMRFTRLTHLDLSGCRKLSSHSVDELIGKSPHLRSVKLANLPNVTRGVLDTLAQVAPALEDLDISRCFNLDADDVHSFVEAIGRNAPSSAAAFKELRIAGLPARYGDASGLLGSIGRNLPALQVLDLSYAAGVTDAGLAAMTAPPDEGEALHETDRIIKLTPRQAGAHLNSDSMHPRRVLPALKHLNLSSCRGITDRACSNLAHAVPSLEILELANLGGAIKDRGIAHLLETTPLIRRVDLEGATEITNVTIDALTPPAGGGEISRSNTGASRIRLSLRNVGGRHSSTGGQGSSSRSTAEQAKPATPVPGSQLTHLIVSHATQIDPTALATLVRRCPSLVYLDADDTRSGDILARLFVKLARERGHRGACISLVDCREVTRQANADLGAAGNVRPRAGRRGYDFSRFLYQDPDSVPDASAASGSGRHAAAQALASASECDDSRVVLRTFWMWTSVDHRVKARRRALAKAKAAQASKSRRASLGAALGLGGGSGSGGSGGDSPSAGSGGNASPRSTRSGGGAAADDAEGRLGVGGRLGRLASGIMTPGDEAEDPRNCIIA